MIRVPLLLVALLLSSTSYSASFIDYKKAADNGSEKHQLYVAKLYFEGKGTKKDLTSALRYFVMSYKNGNKRSLKWITKTNELLKEDRYYFLDEIKISDALFHVGMIATVCDKAYDFKGSQDFAYLNMGGRYPNQLIGVKIDSSKLPLYLKRFGPLSTLEGKSICVRGEITVNEKEKTKGMINVSPVNPDFISIR